MARRDDVAAEGFEDWWSRVWPHLAVARAEAARMVTEHVSDGDVARMYYKARKGWIEHGGGIVSMCDDDLLREARAEVDDLTVYLAALEARRAADRRRAL